ncbi:MAG: sunset domain-containing protein [Mesorhizobium sp.]
MSGNVYQYRRVKHGAPRKFKVLAEDNRPRLRTRGLGWLAVIVAGAFGVGYFGDDLGTSAIASYAVSQVSPSCNIKGNISINTGARIYHVPGQKFYDETIIRPEYGERWFCSEADARTAGWRKAQR